MFNKRSTFLGLLSGILFMGSALSIFAQVTYSKSLFYDTTQSDEIFGIPDIARGFPLFANQDTAGTYLRFENDRQTYAYFNDGSRWTSLFSANTVYDTSNPPPRLHPLGFNQGKAIILSFNNIPPSLDMFYLSDGALARNVAANAQIGGVNPNSLNVTTYSFSEGSNYFAASPASNQYIPDIYVKQGDNPLVKLNSSPLIDPTDNQRLAIISRILPSPNGIVLLGETPTGGRFFQYNQSGITPFLEQSGDFFGDGEVSLGITELGSSKTKDALVLSYGYVQTGENGYAIYSNGSLTKLVEVGQQMADIPGIVSQVLHASIENDTVLMTVRLINPENSHIDTAYVLYTKGSYQLIERFTDPDPNVEYFFVDGLVNNSFLVTQSYANSTRTQGGMRVFRYSIVPEPGTLALFVSLSLIGLMYTRRRNKN